jgi:DNA modification methylase
MINGVTPAMARRIEFWPVDRLVPYAKNARTHSAEQVAQIAASIAEFGFCSPILVDAAAGIIAGHGRLLAARKLGLADVPVIVLDHLSATQKRAFVLADNRLTELGGWNDELLAAELAALEADGFDVGLTGFSDQDLAVLLADETQHAPPAAESDGDVPEAPVVAVTQPGDLWTIGPHRLMCGDCRDAAVVSTLFGGRKAAVAITSPPYATQREYDPSSGFKPVPPDEYVAWYRAVAAGIESVLSGDGSYLLNIKEHAEGGQRHLYVKDLFIAHVRQWGWRFVDEFCWRKTDNGVPGGWNNRFKNAWEPIAHFSRSETIRFHPFAVGHLSEDCFDYSPDNPKSKSGSGLLGTGARGDAAGKSGSRDEDGRREGIARPSNVIEAKTESSQGSHSAPFPRAIPEFFIKAFSDAGDVAYDPFMGSGTTMAAAAALERVGYGTEISPAYCDVILRRIAQLTGEEPVLASAGKTFTAVAGERGVPASADANPKASDGRRIQHRGPAPFYGSRKAS